jgi:hypothetical protein
MFGAAAYLNDWAGALGAWALLPGFVMLALLFIFWFGTVIGESERGIFNLQVDRSFRMAMMWFIFSEVMFFAAFFAALFYARVLSVPWLGGEGVKIHQPAAVEGLRQRMADQRTGRCRRRFRHRPRVRRARSQYRDPARERHYGNDCAPRLASRQSRRAQHLSGSDLSARLSVRRSAGHGVR